ncbi:hypothetical protein [Mycobacterium sp.]|uniref:hypothetical protein n=1 Tax=Mycobacterium sp. TaxID=1785 RepID=UPI003F993648
MPALEDRGGWISRAPMWRWRRLLVVGGVCVLIAGGVRVAHAAPPAPAAVLRVGSYQGIPGQYSSIQAAVDAARPGDWVLIGPGDYHETGNRVPPGAVGDDTAGAAVLVTTPGIHIRGMDRNGVVLDGTKPGASWCSSATADQDPGPLGPDSAPTGRNGLIVFKASGVSVENLTACNFLSGADTPGDEIWFDGGGSSGTQQIGSWRGAFMSATSSYFAGENQPFAQYGIYASNTFGPGLFTQGYANNMGDAAFYIGACPDCNTILDHAHAQNSAQGYSGTNSGGRLIVQNSEFDHNHTGFSTNSQNNDDQPSPQSGHCPGNGTGPTGTHSCWLFTHNSVHDNNNPDVPTSPGVVGSSPVGTGILISGGRFDTVNDNDIHDNGAWGVLLVPEVDTATPPPIAHCKGGFGLSALSFCYFNNKGNEIENNTLSHNGFFGNPSNVDLAEISTLAFPGNCWHGNVDTSGTVIGLKHFQRPRVTSDPLFIQYFLHGICGIPDAGAGIISILSLEVACDSQFLGPCPSTVVTNYPRQTAVQMMALPPQPSMPNPCLDVPRNPWCPTNPTSPPPYPVPGSTVR